MADKQENPGAESNDVLLRGGERIELEKEEAYFTALVDDAEQLERVKGLPGVKAVKPVENRVYKVEVDEQARDESMANLRAQALGGVCHHAYRPKGDRGTRYYITDRIAVRFRDDTPAADIERMLRERGLRVLKQYRGQSSAYLVQVTNATGKNPIKASHDLAALEAVESAEPDLVQRFRASYEPTDDLFAEQWHLRSWSGVELVAGADVAAPAAWDITRGRRDVVVAVMDDGFDLGHPDFQGTGKVVHPKDYVDGDANPFPSTEAGDYHGTPCAGVAIAEENGEGVVGAAPGCAFMPVRFPLSADDDTLWEIFDFVGNRADIISCSWGPPPVYASLSTLLHDKLHDLATQGGTRGKGCVILFAAGNYNAPLHDPNNTSFTWSHPQYGLIETTGPIVNGFAVHPDVLAVAASTSLNRKSAYSNWGAEIAVSAPSNNFHPLDGNEYVPGRGIWTTDNEAFGQGFTGGSRFTGHFGGTSSATPLAAGVAALTLSANPALSADEVRDILKRTADRIEDGEPDPVLGLSKGRYDENGHSEWFGYGKVNADRAVHAALAAITAPVQQVRVSATPQLAIPDADRTGVQSRIQIDSEGAIERIRVGIDIEHTYIGDLVVTLVAPGARRVVLHERNGGSSNDLRKVYEAETLPALGDLVGTEVRGTWTLEVADHAWRDRGTLRQWSIDAELSGAAADRVESSPALRIPDNDPNGINDRLFFAGARTIAGVEVELDITHSWIDDLRVILQAPGGTSVVLHDRTGGNADNIRTTLDVGSVPDLGRLIGQEAHGEWQLTVSDHARRDIGKLNLWAIRIS